MARVSHLVARSPAAAGTSAGDGTGVGPAPAGAEKLGGRLAAAGRAASEGLRRQLAPVGLDSRQFRVLADVAASGCCPQRSLTTKLGIPPSRIVGILDALEERGLVERWEAPGDRRAHAVRLTRAGAAVLAEARPLVAAHEEALASGLSATDVGVLARLLDRVLANCDPPCSGGCG